MGERQTRTVREVLDDHLERRRSGELDVDIERNYHEDVVILNPTRVLRGFDGVRECAAFLAEAVDDPADYRYDSINCDERVALLEWSVRTEDRVIDDGVDTFVIEDGKIRLQTVRYTVRAAGLSQTAGLD